MTGDKDNPKTIMDSVEFLDGSVVEHGWNYLSNTFYKYGGKAKDKAYEWMGMEDIDGDGKRDFNISSAITSTAGKAFGVAGGVGLFTTLKKLFNLSWGDSFKYTAIIASLLVGGALIYNYFKGKPTKDFADVAHKGANINLQPKQDGLSGEVNKNLTTAEVGKGGKPIEVRFKTGHKIDTKTNIPTEELEPHQE